MSEKKSPDEGQFDQGLTEEFDFGETETVSRNIQSAPTHGLNKKILGGMILVVLGVLGIMGYKVFFTGAKSATVATTPNTTANIKASPNVAPQKATPPQKSQPTSTAASQNNEQNFGDIAAAFSSDSNNIHELKKELFTPEKVPANATPSPTSSSENPTQAEATQLTAGLTQLNHQIDYILNQIKYLDSYSREVSDNLNKLNDAISAMDNRIATLTHTTSSLSKDMGHVRNEVGHVKQVLKEDGLEVSLTTTKEKKKPEPKEAQISSEDLEYTVHAVIPGRAWLKSSKGKIVTVAEGESIGDYGKILVIDAANGVVLTSSGIAFH